MKLSERIKFKTEGQSIGSDAKAASLLKRIKEVAKLEPRFDDRLERICVMVSCTPTAEFNLEGNPHPSVIQLHDEWEKRETFKTEDWARFALWLPDAIINEWVDQWKAQQDLPDLDPAQVPASQLSADQQEEIKRPGSPLADGESSSGNPSLSASRSSGTATRRHGKKTGATAAPSST